MKLRPIVPALVLLALVAAACGAQGSSPSVSALASSGASANPEAVISDVEPGATLTFWTFFLSPTFDDYIQSTIDRFEQTYPGVTVQWEDHQGTFLDEYRNAINSGTQPDVANLSNNAGWVREFAEAGKLLNLSDNLPQEVIDTYYPNLFMDSVVDGSSFQVPWYQAIPVEIVNTKIFEDAGLSVDDFPTSFDGVPDLCQKIKDATDKLCDIRLSVTDYLAQMAYEGGVDVMNDDSSAFTFDSAEGVAWLQTYVDMVKNELVDRSALTTEDDRVGLDLFNSGEAPFYQTGPQLIRETKDKNPDLYEQLAIAPFPIGRSGVIQPTSQGIAVKADTQYPRAAMALAAFFTSAKSQLEFSKLVAVYPSTPAAYEDPFFTEEPALIEDSARPLAQDLIEKEQNILPSIPNAAKVNNVVRTAVEKALFGGADPQQALSDAVAQANKLL